MMTNEYDYRGRTFQITIARYPVGYGADLAERGPAGEWIVLDHTGDFHAIAAGALVEATKDIRWLVDMEEGMPF